LPSTSRPNEIRFSAVESDSGILEFRTSDTRFGRPSSNTEASGGVGQNARVDQISNAAPDRCQPVERRACEHAGRPWNAAGRLFLHAGECERYSDFAPPRPMRLQRFSLRIGNSSRRTVRGGISDSSAAACWINPRNIKGLAETAPAGCGHFTCGWIAAVVRYQASANSAGGDGKGIPTPGRLGLRLQTPAYRPA
jgi:hypothetical protein